MPDARGGHAAIANDEDTVTRECGRDEDARCISMRQLSSEGQQHLVLSR